jgi:hypothetical protein
MGPDWKWYDDGMRINLHPGTLGIDYKQFVWADRVKQTPFDNLLWRAKRQWYRWFP